MKQLYKDGKSKPVHTYQVKAHLENGWSTEKGEDHVQERLREVEERPQEEKEVKLNKTQKHALELGLEIYDEDGKLLHHKKLAKIIEEATQGDDN